MGTIYGSEYILRREGQEDKLKMDMYIGEVDNLRPSGIGVIKRPQKQDRYFGDFLDGSEHGIGTYSNISTKGKKQQYRGEFKKGCFDGVGKFEDMNREDDFHEGYYKDH